jgi:hypothetical protein
MATMRLDDRATDPKWRRFSPRGRWSATTFRFIATLPSEVMGIKAVGTVRRAGLSQQPWPCAEVMIGKGPIGMLGVIGKNFKGLDLEALCYDGDLLSNKAYRGRDGASIQKGIPARG